jgi:sec-independent protein translocase protein TatB
MFDFAWSEIALIGVVALIAIGPKDMPVAIKAVTDMIKKARRMAGEFQTHVDEMVREANLDEVRNQINEIRNMDIRGEVERAVDADGSIRATFESDPIRSFSTPAATSPVQPVTETSVSPTATHTIERPAGTDPAPAFIPPDAAPPPAAPEAGADQAPAFIPPEITRSQEPGATRA